MLFFHCLFHQPARGFGDCSGSHRISPCTPRQEASSFCSVTQSTLECTASLKDKSLVILKLHYFKWHLQISSKRHSRCNVSVEMTMDQTWIWTRATWISSQVLFQLSYLSPAIKWVWPSYSYPLQWSPWPNIITATTRTPNPTTIHLHPYSMLNLLYLKFLLWTELRNWGWDTFTCEGIHL